MNRLAPERLSLKATFHRVRGEIDKMEERVARLDAAHEVLSLRQAKTAPHGCARTERNETGVKPLISKETAKRLIQRPQ